MSWDVLLTEAEMASARADAESLMLDEGQAKRPTGKTARNEETGLSEPTFADLFTTRCKVQPTSGDEVTTQTVTVGGVERVVYKGGIHMPIPEAGSAAVDLRRGDRLTILSIGPMTDPGVLGKTYEVVGFSGKSWATARRLDVVEVD